MRDAETFWLGVWRLVLEGGGDEWEMVGWVGGGRGKDLGGTSGRRAFRIYSIADRFRAGRLEVEFEIQIFISTYKPVRAGFPMSVRFDDLCASLREGGRLIVACWSSIDV